MSKHLIHIGYPKAGSTFLQAWFQQHPELYYKHGGLAGFHDIYEVCRPTESSHKYFVTSYEGISTPHKDAGRSRTDVGLKRPILEPIQIRQKSVCETLGTLYPGSRILIITRGFKSMMMSGYSQYVRSGGIFHLDEMFFRFGDDVSSDVYHTYDVNYLIELYSKNFGGENLIVLPYELLRDDKSKFFAILEQRLGIEHVEPNFGRLNPSLTAEELYWYPLISRRVSSIAQLLGDRAFRKIYDWYIRKTMVNKLRRIIRLLQRIKPDRKITIADFPMTALMSCQGKATCLKNDPLYAPYADEYLWNS